MKKIVIATLACLVILGTTSIASATVILPGTGQVLTGATVATGTAIKSLVSVPFTGLDASSNVYFTGNLWQNVYLNSTGLLFEYWFTNDSTSPDAIQAMSVTNFSGWLTDVNVSTSGWNVTRGSSGSTVSFFAPSGGWVTQGTTSPTFWVQTDAKHFSDGSTQLQDGGNSTTWTYGPTIPEPATMAMFGIGMLGCGILRKKGKA